MQPSDTYIDKQKNSMLTIQQSKATSTYMNHSDNVSVTHSVLSAVAVSTKSIAKTSVPSPGKIGMESAQKVGTKQVKGLDGINVAQSGLQFQVDDFIIPRFFKPYISKIVLPDGLILSRIDKLVEKILTDFEGE